MRITKVKYTTFTRTNDRNGNPHGIVKIELNNKTFWREYYYEADYQAAENCLRKAIFKRYPTYQNDVNPSFLVMRTHIFKYEIERNPKLTDKKVFVLENNGSFQVTISEFNRMKEYTC